MKYIEHYTDSSIIVEVLSDMVIIKSEQDVLDLMVNIDYQYNSRKIILHRDNLCSDFFDLKTGIAGFTMQKFSNYRFRAAIVGHINYKSKSLNAFIAECNRTRQVIFTDDVATALKELT